MESLMKNKCVGLLIILLIGSLVYANERDKETKPPSLIATIAIPVSAKGSRTTFRFIVRNTGDSPTGVNDPFVDSTRLWVIYPDGKKVDFGGWKEGLIPRKLDGGKERSWTIDLQDRNRAELTQLNLKQKGQYTIYFSVGNIESNKVIVVRD